MPSLHRKSGLFLSLLALAAGLAGCGADNPSAPKTQNPLTENPTLVTTLRGGSTEGGNAITFNIRFGRPATLSTSWADLAFTTTGLGVVPAASCDPDRAVEYRPTEGTLLLGGADSDVARLVWPLAFGRKICGIVWRFDPSATAFAAHGVLADGRSAALELPLPDGLLMSFGPAVLALTPGRNLSWLLSVDMDRLLPPEVLKTAVEDEGGVLRFDAEHNADLLPIVRNRLIVHTLLYLDLNGNGLLESGETLLAQGVAPEAIPDGDACVNPAHCGPDHPPCCEGFVCEEFIHLCLPDAFFPDGDAETAPDGDEDVCPVHCGPDEPPCCEGFVCGEYEHLCLPDSIFPDGDAETAPDGDAEPGPLLDILFVVGCSAGMEPFQQRFADNMMILLALAADEGRADLHVGVVAASPQNGTGGGEFVGSPAVLATGEGGLTPAKIFATLQERVLLGGACDASEESGLEMVHLALSSPATLGEGFLRENAKLVLIFLSNRDDGSSASINFYVDFFRTIHGSASPEKLEAYAMVGDAETGCSCLLTGPCSALAGNAYVAFADTANLQADSFASVCREPLGYRDYARILARNLFGVELPGEEVAECVNPVICGVGLQPCCEGYTCSNTVHGITGFCE